MKDFKYKCVVTKNGMKMYYKKVKGKWKRISNDAGKKAEKGKKKYNKSRCLSEVITDRSLCEAIGSCKWENGTCKKNLFVKNKQGELIVDTIFEKYIYKKGEWVDTFSLFSFPSDQNSQMEKVIKHLQNKAHEFDKVYEYNKEENSLDLIGKTLDENLWKKEPKVLLKKKKEPEDLLQFENTGITSLKLLKINTEYNKDALDDMYDTFKEKGYSKSDTLKNIYNFIVKDDIKEMIENNYRVNQTEEQKVNEAFRLSICNGQQDLINDQIEKMKNYDEIKNEKIVTQQKNLIRNCANYNYHNIYKIFYIFREVYVQIQNRNGKYFPIEMIWCLLYKIILPLSTINDKNRIMNNEQMDSFLEFINPLIIGWEEYTKNNNNNYNPNINPWNIIESFTITCAYKHNNFSYSYKGSDELSHFMKLIKLTSSKNIVNMIKSEFEPEILKKDDLDTTGKIADQRTTDCKEISKHYKNLSEKKIKEINNADSTKAVSYTFNDIIFFRFFPTQKRIYNNIMKEDEYVIDIFPRIELKNSLVFTINKKNTYFLKSMIIHTGATITSGHYFVFVRTGEKIWYEANDREIKKLNENEVQAIINNNLSMVSFATYEKTNNNGKWDNNWNTRAPLSIPPIGGSRCWFASGIQALMSLGPTFWDKFKDL